MILLRGTQSFIASLFLRVVNVIWHNPLTRNWYLGRFDLVDCLLDYRNALTIHGDDVLAHSNWEIGESWLRKYGYVLFICFGPTAPLDLARWLMFLGPWPFVRLAGSSLIRLL